MFTIPSRADTHSKYRSSTPYPVEHLGIHLMRRILIIRAVIIPKKKTTPNPPRRKPDYYSPPKFKVEVAKHSEYAEDPNNSNSTLTTIFLPTKPP